MNLHESTAHPPALDQKLFSPFTAIGPTSLSQTHYAYDHIRTGCKYYSLENQSVTFDKPGCPSHLSIIHINARSILSADKFSEFQVFLHLTKCKWAVICVSETWLRDELEIDRDLVGYTCFFDNRVGGTGGGVAIYVRNDCFKKIQQKSKLIKCTESILLECQFNNAFNMTILQTYRPPNLSHNTFIDELRHAIDHLSAQNKTLLVCGDFNYDLLNMTHNSQTFEFFSVLSSVGLLPLISKPTRAHETCASLIDNIYCNNLSSVHNSGIIFDDTSDHFEVFATLNNKLVFTDSIRVTESKLNYRKINMFTDDLIQSLEGFQHITDPDTACNTLLQAYTASITKYSYQHKVNRKNSSIKPWISPAILSSIINRSKLFALKQKHPSRENKYKYCHYRNILNTIIRVAKHKYIEAQLELNKNNAKRVWDILNEYAIGKTITNRLPRSFMNDDGKQIDNPNEIADNFNNFFSSIGEKLQSKIGICDESPLSYIKQCDNIISELELTSCDELIQIVTNMKNVGAGIDKINGKLFKLTYKTIIHHIVHLVNICLKTGKFPKKLKIAVVKPVFKSGEKSNMNNYRPISILPYLSKVLEKIIHHRIMNHVTNNTILCSNQFGFRKGLSTYMPLLILQDQVTKGFELNKITCGIYLDLKKAFDTVDHGILLKKLGAYGFKNTCLNIINSYLTDRYQCVEYENITSNLRNVNIGVPQGSILGPLLFILYINDFPDVCREASTLLYADDTAIFFQSSNADELQSMLDSYLPLISKWFIINKLSLNTNKTFFQLYNVSERTINIKVKLNDNDIKHSDTVRYLGMFIDTNLKWKSHINHISATVSRNVGVMNRSRFFLGSKHLSLLYNSLVLPYLNYCCLIWGHSSQSLINKLFILQKKAVRIIDNQPKIAHSNPIFAKLKLLKLKDIAKQQSILLMHSVITQNAPFLIGSIFNLSPTNNRASRVTRHFNETFTRKQYCIRTVAWIGPRLWNSLLSPIFPHIAAVPSTKQTIKDITKRQIIEGYLEII